MSLALAVLCADAIPEPPRNDVFIGSAVGAGAGISLLPPVPYAAPWVELEAGYDRKLFTHGLFDFRGSLALGPAPDGGTLIGGYTALLEGGRDWFDTGFVKLSSYGRGGVISYALAPLPMVGIGHTLKFTLIDGERWRWAIAFDFNTDWIVLPAASGSLWTFVGYRSGAFTVGLRLKGAWGASLWKGLGVSAGARLSAGVDF